MFALPAPYTAELFAGTSWQPCRVIGIAIDNSTIVPRYVVEHVRDGVSYLSLEDHVRKAPPTNPT